MALPMPMLPKKPNPKRDALAAMMDTSAIADVTAPKTGAGVSAPPALAGQQRGMQAPTTTKPLQPTIGFGGGRPVSPTVQIPTKPTAPRGLIDPAMGNVNVPKPKDPVGNAAVGTTTPPPAAPAATDSDIDALIRSFVEDKLKAANNVDTSAEEALIRDQTEGKLGASLVDQRARMGRAGFGSAGVTAALESDARTSASRDALDQILGLRRDEEQRAFDNATSAVGTEQGMRSAAADDAIRRMLLESAQSEAGLEGDSDGNGQLSTAEAQKQWAGEAIEAGADTNGDGVLSAAEKDAYKKQGVAGHQAFSDYFKGGGELADLPTAAPGGAWEVVFPPGEDRQGNPKPGQLFNRETGQIAIYT